MTNSQQRELHETIDNNTRIIDSLTTLVTGFDYGAYDDNTIPDCMTVIARLAEDTRQAGEDLMKHWKQTTPTQATEG